MNLFLRRALAAIAVFVMLTIFGSLACTWVEGATLADAIYMTVSTPTAVGYQKVGQADRKGGTT